jgi:hypothetical protein
MSRVIPFESDFHVRGDLHIVRRAADTKDILSVWKKKNVIVFDGTEVLVKLMAPNAAFGPDVQEESQIKSMRFGTDSTTPQRTDTDLANEAVVASNPVRVALADANRIVGASGTVEFTAILASGDGNGVTYREAGLFTRGDNDDPLLTTPGTEEMFSRQVYPDQPKTAAVELEFHWRITFTV